MTDLSFFILMGSLAGLPPDLYAKNTKKTTKKMTEKTIEKPAKTTKKTKKKTQEGSLL